MRISLLLPLLLHAFHQKAESVSLKHRIKANPAGSKPQIPEPTTSHANASSVKSTSSVSLLSDAGKPGSPYDLFTHSDAWTVPRKTLEQGSALNALDKQDLGGLDPSEVFLANKNMIIVKGFTYKKNYKSDPSGEAIDSYAAPQAKAPPLPESGTVFQAEGSRPFLPPPPPHYDSSKRSQRPPQEFSLPHDLPKKTINDWVPFTPLFPRRTVDYYFPTNYTTPVPPGPFGSGIFLPPPKSYFAPREAKETDQTIVKPLNEKLNIPNYYESVKTHNATAEESKKSVQTSSQTAGSTKVPSQRRQLQRQRLTPSVRSR